MVSTVLRGDVQRQGIKITPKQLAWPSCAVPYVMGITAPCCPVRAHSPERSPATSPAQCGTPATSWLPPQPRATAAPPLCTGLSNSSSSSRVVLMLSCSSSCPRVPKPRGTGHKPCRIHLCLASRASCCIPEPMGAHGTSSPGGLTAHHDCAHTPLAHLHSGGRYFLHISDNSADGQSLSRLFLPSGQKSHVTIAPQKSNPSQCGGYPPKMWIWGLALQLRDGLRNHPHPALMGRQ